MATSVASDSLAIETPESQSHEGVSSSAGDRRVPFLEKVASVNPFYQREDRLPL